MEDVSTFMYLVDINVIIELYKQKLGTYPHSTHTLDRKLIERRIVTEASSLVHLLFGCVPWDTAARAEAKTGSFHGVGLQVCNIFRST